MPSLLQYWRDYRSSRGARRELLTILLCLVMGLTAMPVLIWAAGSWKLGPYANGGLLALERDFYAALSHGSLVFWLVALGPYAAVWLLRGLRLPFRR
jgi:hypothetical protein